jgi:hypothetical protein
VANVARVRQQNTQHQLARLDEIPGRMRVTETLADADCEAVALRLAPGGELLSRVFHFQYR